MSEEILYYGNERRWVQAEMGREVAYAPPGEPLPTATPLSPFEGAKRAMAAMTPEQRVEIMTAYCRGCGCVQPDDYSCQCQNDE